MWIDYFKGLGKSFKISHTAEVVESQSGTKVKAGNTAKCSQLLNVTQVGSCCLPFSSVAVALRHGGHERDVGEGVDRGSQVEVESRADARALVAVVVELVDRVGRREGGDRLGLGRGAGGRPLRPRPRLCYSPGGETLSARRRGNRTTRVRSAVTFQIRSNREPSTNHFLCTAKQKRRIGTNE